MISQLSIAVANIRRPIIGPAPSIYKQTTVKATSSSTSVQKAITSLGGQTTHATLPIKAQSTLATTTLGAKPAPQPVGLGGIQATPGKNLLWLVVGFIAVVIIFVKLR
jgi:hypothetical protein